MRLFKEKLAWAAPIAVILIIALFSVNLFAQGDPKVRELPVALIVNDAGEHVDSVLKATTQLTTSIDGEAAVFKFTEETSDSIEQAFHDKKYYGALVIPKDFNQSMENILTTGEQAKLEILVNQGFNLTGSNVAKNTLTSLVSGLNAQYAQLFLQDNAQQQINASFAKVYVQPIRIDEQIYNPITAKTANGSAPTLMAVPAWVGALIGGFVLFLSVSSLMKKNTFTRRDQLRLMLGQIAFGVIIALFSGFTVATLATLANIAMPSYLLVASYISFAAFCFYLLVIAITSWIGKPAITLFMVVMLLGMGVLMTPQEMLPDFFVNFIRPWVPIRFASEGLREIFYFGSGFYTGSSFLTILSIGIGGLIIFFLSIFKPKKSSQS